MEMEGEEDSKGEPRLRLSKSQQESLPQSLTSADGNNTSKTKKKKETLISLKYVVSLDELNS